MTLSPQLQRLGRFLTVIAFIAISVLAIKISHVPLIDQTNDKFKHMLAFAYLAAGLSLFWSWSWQKVSILLLIYGVVIELVQSFVPGRYASAWDVLADCVGIALGILSARMLGALRV